MTMIEAIVYVALFSLMFAVIVETTLTVGSAFRTSRVRKNVNLEGGAALERIMREAHLAHGINTAQSTLGTTSSKIVFDTILGPSDETVTTREFYLQNGAIIFKEGSASPSPLTSSNVRVRELIFYEVGTSTFSRAMRAQITIEGGSGKSYIEEHFYDAAVLRRTY